MLHTTARTNALLAACLFALAALSGCASAIRADCANRGGDSPDFGGFTPVPQPRMGSIPFPGIVSLYAITDPEDLGEHIYQDGTPFKGLVETGRGLMYTCRAGFLDLAHIRNTVDNTAHIHARMRYALRNSRRCVRFRLAEPSIYTVEIAYPEAWFALEQPERERLADDLAITAGEAIGFHAMTWHEILTWYGYKSAIVISEKGSAFTYEDIPSHAVGARIAGRALRDLDAIRASAGAPESEPGTGEFADAVTAALDEMLGELGVVEPEASRDAVDLVGGRWWSEITVNRRLVVSGTGGEAFEPWLVPGAATCDGASPIAFRFPPLHRLSDSEACPSLVVRIDPKVREEGEILQTLAEAQGVGTRPPDVGIEADFPLLIAQIRAEIIEQNGEDALRP